MRKDVRTGAVIGGVLIAVVIVYAVVTSKGQPKNKPVVLDTNGKTIPAGATSGGADRSGDVLTPPPRADRTDTTPAPTRDSATEAPIAPAAAPGTPAHVEDGAPTLLAESTVGQSKTNWGAIFIADRVDGAVPPVRTSTPDPAPPLVDPAPPALPEATTAGSEIPAEPRTVVADSTAGSPTTTTPEPAKTDDKTAPAASGAAPKTHRIQSGETFSSIARDVYGDAKYFKEIAKANPKVDSAHMHPGDLITLPDRSQFKQNAKPVTPATAAAEARHAAPAPVDPKTEYRVASSDNLYKISMKLYNMPNKVDAIYQLNKATIGSDPAKLKLGMVLKLPEPPTQTASR